VQKGHYVQIIIMARYNHEYCNITTNTRGVYTILTT